VGKVDRAAHEKKKKCAGREGPILKDRYGEPKRGGVNGSR
jgi:hypothetical protein